jgi:hypothetical protein
VVGADTAGSSGDCGVIGTGWLHDPLRPLGIPLDTLPLSHGESVDEELNPLARNPSVELCSASRPSFAEEDSDGSDDECRDSDGSDSDGSDSIDDASIGRDESESEGSESEGSESDGGGSGASGSDGSGTDGSGTECEPACESA